MSGVVHIIKRDLMRVRTAAGPDAARANGRRGGDWPKSMTAAKLVLAKLSSTGFDGGHQATEV